MGMHFYISCRTSRNSYKNISCTWTWTSGHMDTDMDMDINCDVMFMCSVCVNA